MEKERVKLSLEDSNIIWRVYNFGTQCPRFKPGLLRDRHARCYRLVVRAVTRAFVKCTKVQRLKKRNMGTLWINQITGASQEHGLKYPAFTVNLVKCQVELNSKVLVDLAICEPKTFKSLAALAKRRKEPESIFSRGEQYH
uniref:Large ribosomal subunit protein bL20m n=1 Tax=Ursus americanus TaxID=9643 RepID=A0A452SX43_URSAM